MSPGEGRLAVFITHLDGRLVESVRDDFDLAVHHPEADRLSRLFSARTGTLADLLDRIARDGLLFDTPRTLRELHGDSVLFVAGARHLSYLFLVIGERREAVESGFQAMARGFREYLDQFRRQTANQRASFDEGSGLDLFEEISRLNNELVNTQRELAKKLQELETALEHVKQLEGLIPICANCKRIRNDQGYWEEVDQYIQAHSEAQFSHGLCDQCKIELYPELFARPPEKE